ncbi:MAG: TonB-dependent receptor [Dyella sp.]
MSQGQSGAAGRTALFEVRRRRWLVLCCACWPCLGLAWQATGQLSVTTLPTVKVVPAPLPGMGIDPDHLPYLVQRIDYDRNRTDRAANLVGVLVNQVSGVNLNDVQGSPFQSDITFHGYRASPTLGAGQGVSVYLDGVRMNEPFGDIISWDVMPEAALQSLTVIPGANPVFGPNTLGGALVFTTKTGASAPGLDLDLSYGSYARKRVDLAYGVSDAQGWQLFVAGTWFDENGWREQSPGRLGNGFLSFGRDSADTRWDVQLLDANSHLIGNGLLPASGYDEDTGEFSAGLYQRDRRAIYTAPDFTRNQVTQLATHVSHDFSEDTMLTALAYTRHSRRDTINGDISDDYQSYVENCAEGFAANGQPLDDGCGFTAAQGAALPTAVLNTTHTRQQGQGGGLNLSSRQGDHQWAMGVTFDRSTVRYSQYEQDAELDARRAVQADPAEPSDFFSGVNGHSRAWGSYATDTWALTPDTHLTGSLRWNDQQVTSTIATDQGGQPSERHVFRKLNPALGLTQRLGGGITLFAGAAQSNRAPTVIELGCADPAQPCRLPTGLQADPPLRQVVARSYQVGARWRGDGGWAAALELYRSDNRNDILFLRAPLSQQGYFDNFARTRNQGADLTLSQQRKDFSWHVSYSLLQATYQANGELLAGERTIQAHPGMRIAGLPKHTAKLGADWQPWPRLSVGADLLVYSSSVTSGNEDGRIEDDNPLRQDWATPGYAIVNLRASYRPSEQVEWYLRVDNLFDRRYLTYAQIAEDDLPDGQLIRPQVAPGEGSTAQFVAPGAPRLFTLGVRLHF